MTEGTAIGQDMLPVGDLDGDGIGDLAVMTGVDDPGLIFLRGTTVSR